MAEEFQGGVCSGAWWNSNLFSGGGGGFSTPCAVAQLGGGNYYDMENIGWPHEIMKGKSNNDQVCDDNNLVFPADFDSTTLDILGFGLSLPTSLTTDINLQNQFYKGGCNDGNNNSMLLQDNLSSHIRYEIDSTIFPSNSQDGSPHMTMTTTSSNSGSSGDSSTIITGCGEGGLTTSYPTNSSASYLIQTLFNDDVDGLFDPNNYGSNMDSQVWANTSGNNGCTSLIQPPCLELPLSDCNFDGGMNVLSNKQQLSDNTATTLSNIRASLLNSLQSRSRATTFNQKSPNCGANVTTKLKREISQESKKNIKNDQPTTKRPRIETPSSLPTFKVRKEKLGDRITALQQLVSPFGKTDTASVLHEAIDYIKFLHDQVHALSTPYLKKGVIAQHQQVSNGNGKVNNQDLRSRGLCLVPISSTYPVTQETPVDFWTPTFGGTTTFR